MRPNLKFSALMISALFSTPLARANIVGTDAQNFNPTTSGLDFVTVQSARTLDPGVFNIGLFLNGAANTLSFLDDADPDAKSSRTKIKDTLLSADLNFGVGLGKKIDIGLSLPFLLKQDIENSDRVAYFSTTGNTEQRLNAKYRFFESDDFSAATVLSVNRNNIANNPYTGSSPGLITNLELAFLKKINDSWLGLNLGHRWRDSGKSLIGTFGIDPIPNQGIYSLAWSRMFAGTDSKLIIEVFGSFPSQTSSSNSNFTDRDRSNLETLLGIKNQYSENLALHAGAGTEIVQGFGTPDYRIYAGINWNFGPLFQKTVKQAYQQKIQEQPQVTPQIQKFILSNLKFKLDSTLLDEDSIKQVDQVVEIIKGVKNIEKILVEGHTDSSGTEEYNLKLSEDRSFAIKRLLVAGVPIKPEIIESKGYGESISIADNSNYQGRAANRRVVITVFSRVADAQGKDQVLEIKLTN